MRHVIFTCARYEGEFWLDCDSYFKWSRRPLLMNHVIFTCARYEGEFRLDCGSCFSVVKTRPLRIRHVISTRARYEGEFRLDKRHGEGRLFRPLANPGGFCGAARSVGDDAAHVRSASPFTPRK